MKKTQKKVFGIFALAFVVAMTIFAAFLPAPRTQAVSVNDVITVRVIGAVPMVETTGIESGSTITSPLHTTTTTYENIDSLTAAIKYTGTDGNEHIISLIDTNVNYAPGQLIINTNYETGTYDYSYVYYDDNETPQTITGQGQLPYFGFGDYILMVSGRGYDGATDNGDISFAYLPVSADVSSEDNSGTVKIDLDYDPDTEAGGTGEVSELIVNIYDKDGNLVAGSPITVIAPEKNIEIPFSDYGLSSGDYTLEVFAYNRNGEVLSDKPFVTHFTYIYDDGRNKEEEEGSPSIVVPNTGGIIGGLNISRMDYLASGLLVFFIAGIGGVIFIIKRGKSSKRK